MEIELVKVACPIVAGNPDGYYLAESLPAGAKLYKEGETVIRLQPEPQHEPEVVVEQPIVEPEPVAKTIIEVDMPDTRSNEYFNAMSDEELKAYLDSNKIKYHHLSSKKTLIKLASEYANMKAK